MAGSKAVAVVLGASAVAGIVALAAGAKAATKPGPRRTGGPDAGNATPTNTSGGSPPERERTIPSTVPGVPNVTIKPGDADWLANELALHLTTLQVIKGSVDAARGKENRELVKAFQKAAKLATVDGLSGPATLIAIARRGTGTLPLVMYWPKKATEKTVAAYRTALRAIAADAPAEVAEQLRASAEREQGQALSSHSRPIDLPAGAVTR